MNTETTIKPQPKLILPFLAWNFGWTWGFWLLDIILKNLWPDSPPTAYLALEAILNGIALFGPMLASLIVLKKRLQGHLLLSLFRQERDLALLANLWWWSDRLLCPSFWWQAGRRRFSKISLVFYLLYCPIGRD